MVKVTAFLSELLAEGAEEGQDDRRQLHLESAMMSPWQIVLKDAVEVTRERYIRENVQLPVKCCLSMLRFALMRGNILRELL